MRSKSADLPAGKAAMTVEVDIDFWFDYLVRFDVRIDLADESGNVMDPPYRTQVEGLFAGVLKFLEWLAEGIASIVAAIAKALSFIVDLIISGLRAAVDAILGPIVQALNSWTNGVISVIQRVFEKHSPSMADLDPTLAASLIHDAIVSPEFYMIVAMCVAVAVIITIVSYILLPFGFIISASLPTS
jgi:hypothetical protein